MASAQRLDDLTFRAIRGNEDDLATRTSIAERYDNLVGGERRLRGPLVGSM
jgi:hypothetical protein